MSKKKEYNYYYSGGFAELVSKPSLITYTFFKEWFTGDASVGHAMELLHLPYEKSSKSILELWKGQLVVNLKTEEETLYGKTFFKYKEQKSLHSVPAQSILYTRLLHPFFIFGTTQILLQQAQWISSPEKQVHLAKSYLQKIPDIDPGTSIEEIDVLLRDAIWPYVIAIGILAEFYSQLLTRECKGKDATIHSYISSQIAKKDWYFLSLSDQLKVKQKEMSFDKYIELYGIRSDKDYELTSPRWSEIKETIQERIAKAQERKENETSDTLKDLTNRQQLLVKTLIEFQLLRSESKRKTSQAFALLRQKMLLLVCNNSCAHDTTCLLQKSVKASSLQEPTTVKDRKNIRLIERNGNGLGISVGKVSGVIYHITDSSANIPDNSIGVFPNASPEYSVQYPMCRGMIFLMGGQTSHGATVAREFGIPAIVYEKASEIPEGVSVTIDGETGDWEVYEEDEEQGTRNIMSNETVLRLSDTKACDVVVVGGKAASLSMMIQHGIPVPDGFVVTNDAYQRYFKKTISEDFKKKVTALFDEYHMSFVAVRSSSLLEDSASLSFAGQLESYLFVTKKNLIENIRACWQSLHSEKVTKYLATKEIGEKNVGMGVIIQEMIDSDISGVLFTENPLSRNSNEILIEYVLGLNELLVQGKVIPSRIVIDKKSGKIVSHESHEQNTRLSFQKGEIKEVAVTEKEHRKLSDTAIEELVELAKKCEEVFSAPQDIEWTIKDGKVYLLQSRPITTL